MEDEEKELSERCPKCRGPIGYLIVKREEELRFEETEKGFGFVNSDYTKDKFYCPSDKCEKLLCTNKEDAEKILNGDSYDK